MHASVDPLPATTSWGRVTQRRDTLSRITKLRLPRQARFKSSQEPGKNCPGIVAIYMMKVIQTISFFFFSFLLVVHNYCMRTSKARTHKQAVGEELSGMCPIPSWSTAIALAARRQHCLAVLSERGEKRGCPTRRPRDILVRRGRPGTACVSSAPPCWK